jgi:hypothetical protein
VDPNSLFRSLEKEEPDHDPKRVVRRRGAILALSCLGGMAAAIALVAYTGGAVFGRWMMALALPLALALLGFLQAITGLPLHRLDRMWSELEESEKRLIVYGLVFGIPIATVWIAYKNC